MAPVKPSRRIYRPPTDAAGRSSIFHWPGLSNALEWTGAARGLFAGKGDVMPYGQLKKGLILILGLLVFAAGLGAVDVRDTKFLSQPAISRTHIAFVYANDLWVADLDGRNVRRLTSDLGLEFAPAFSPDGDWIAFSGQYDGNTDVYIIPVAGGIPKRLTWHPGIDIVQCFTDDGQAVLFTSPRQAHSDRFLQLFSVPVAGGFPEMLSLPSVFRAALSPDGKRIAYNPNMDSFVQWKNYRGGQHSVIWVVNRADLSLEKIPQPENRSNDPDPMWVGDKIYFRSDRNGEFNLFSYDPKTKSVKQHTYHKDFPVVNASAGGGKVIYEQAGHLHIFDPKTDSSLRLKIGIATDLSELRERYAKGAAWIRNADISPSGARAVFEFRGEIVTVPAEKGDPRNITNSPAGHDRAPAWSPDGKSIAYFSDESGEYELVVRSQDGKDAPRRFRLNGGGYYANPVWSPDGKKIAYWDNSWSLFCIDLQTGAIKKIASESLYNFGLIPGASSNMDWSPDSKWIAYTVARSLYVEQVFLYSFDDDRSTAVTDGFSDATEPVFDPSGKYLYFFASTDAAAAKQYLEMAVDDLNITNGIFIVALTKEASNPLAKESDEERGADKPASDRGGESKPAPAAQAGKTASKEASPAGPPAMKIDFQGIERRVVGIPVRTAAYSNLRAGEAGQFYYLEADPAQAQPGSALHKYDTKSRKDEVLLSGVGDYDLSTDHKKILYFSQGQIYITALLPKPQPGQGRLNVGTIEVRVDPPAEWRQVFNEVWRINRDFFYDPHMHGVDWAAMKEKYEAFLPHLSCRADLTRLIQWLCSELSVGHHRTSGGDTPAEVKRIPGGLLGADYSVENGRYRFRKVFGGLNWSPGLRAPLGEPGCEVSAGEYLLAVNGKDLRPPAGLFSFFENTAGKIVEVTVGPNPDGTGSRTLQVVPVANEFALRNRDWVEGNIKRVTEATSGRAAYVWFPNTAPVAYQYFKRYYFPQANREAAIIDDRYNGGGQIADYIIDQLRRPVICYWAMRYGNDLKSPNASIQGPKVMLINETSSSGGDLLPWMFRKFKLGPLVGKRTWGGLVGVLGFPELMDGGQITAPNIGIWTPEEGWVVENIGNPPDVEVEWTPADFAAGRDPQLEKAIQIVLDELKKNPPQKPQRPAYPVKRR
jgi:tricorn protease